jgi:hypothetical protein
MNINFNEYGYANAEEVCACLANRKKENPIYWISRAKKVLKKSKIEISFFPVNKYDDVVSIAKSGKYQLISYKPYLDKPSNISYLANKGGLVKLAQAAKIMGIKINEADSLLKALGPVEDLPVEDFLSDDDESFVIEKDLPEVAALSEIQDDQILTWKKQDVILSSSYAKFCGVKTCHVNRKIRVCEKRGDLTEDVDFIYLDKQKANGFSLMNTLDQTPQELQNGLYLLTQVGVNRLSLYLNNEKAAVHTDTVTSAAAIVQDLERKGMPDILTAFKSLTEIQSRQSEINERLLCAYEATVQSNTSLAKEIRNLSSILENGIGTGMNSNSVQNLVHSVIDSRVYRGEKEIPKYLIGEKDRRKLYFPGISPEVVSAFLDTKNHPQEVWELARENGTLIKVPSYFREGMEQRQKEFFTESSYIKKTECYFYFQLGAVNYMVLRTQTDSCKLPLSYIKNELLQFMSLFCKFHPEYVYNVASDDLLASSILLPDRPDISRNTLECSRAVG